MNLKTDIYSLGLEGGVKEADKVIDGVQVEVITSQIIKLCSQEGDEGGRSQHGGDRKSVV